MSAGTAPPVTSQYLKCFAPHCTTFYYIVLMTRMVVWRNYLVLFGGFYEAMREVRWYNDAYVYSFQEKRWTLIPQRANAQVTTIFFFFR